MRTLLPLLVLAAGAVAGPVEVASPDRTLRVVIETEGTPTYAVYRKDQLVVAPSPLGLILEGGATLTGNFHLEAEDRASRDTTWRPLYGERQVYPDRYRQVAVSLRETIAPRRLLVIRFRAYNEGVAFRYEVPGAPGAADWIVGAEATGFRLPAGARAWETHGAQSTYRMVALDELQPDCERPLTLELPDGTWASIAEAALLDYPTMLLSKSRGQGGGLVVSLGGPARLRLPAETPWRVMLLGDRAGDLLEHNYLLESLSPPSRIHDTSFIRPGKVIRETTLSTKGAREAVDFAARRGISYIEFDAGWYGHEYDEQSDATRVSVDPLRLNPDPEYRGLDLAEAIRYAKGKNIGVLLYVNRRAMERQLDQVLPLFERWGVRGVKYGFVNVGTAEWTRWLYEAVAKAAEHRLMLDIHDNFRPTGLSRTFPNLLTQEGIRGNEEFPDATHNTVMPFTRFVAGAADYTICWTDKRLKNTAAHQLALSVVYYSPFQFLYWYDRPSMVREDDPALAFFDHVPTVWDDTRVVEGRPGEFAVVARRSGEKWFVGAITSTSPRTLAVPMAFLPANRTFTADIYTDGDGPREVRVTHRQVTAADRLEFALLTSGGAAIEIHE